MGGWYEMSDDEGGGRQWNRWEVRCHTSAAGWENITTQREIQMWFCNAIFFFAWNMAISYSNTFCQKFIRRELWRSCKSCHSLFRCILPGYCVPCHFPFFHIKCCRYTTESTSKTRTFLFAFGGISHVIIDVIFDVMSMIIPGLFVYCVLCRE